MKWVVVTDLDGCLLDAESYDWAPARETLRTLQARGVPIVFCTSKSRAEVEALQEETGVRDPFVVEDGAAIVAEGVCEALAPSRGEILVHFRRLREETGGALRGFSEMSADDLAADSGLDAAHAARALRREFDEPFRFLRDETVHLTAVRAYTAAQGLILSRGGRYWHLHGDADKGRAVRRVLARWPGTRSVGLGDSALDLPLLAAVDIPVAVARPDGTHDPVLTARLPALRRTTAPGPRGWCEAVNEIVLAGHARSAGTGPAA